MMENNETNGSADRSRKGEKIGWTGGWLGGFIWLLLLSVFLLVQGRVIAGLAGVVLFVFAVSLIIFFAPWRHPLTKYWKLMLPVYIILFAAIGYALWIFGGLSGLGMGGWPVFWILPCLIPLVTIGNRVW